MKKLKKNLFITTILIFSLASCTQGCKQKVSHELEMFFYNASSEKPFLDSIARVQDSLETRIPCK